MEGSYLSQIIIALLSTSFGATASWAWRKALDFMALAGRKALLFGFEPPSLFVLPHRSEGGPLPLMKTEDFLAVNNLISAFLAAKITPPEKMKTASLLDDDTRRHNNLVLICSSKSNTTTREAFAALRSIYGGQIPYFEANGLDAQGKQKLRIRWNERMYESESYAQEGLLPQGSNGPLDDIAIFMVTKNPWDTRRRMLIVAGVRGIGTWGAAEFCKKWWRELYRELFFPWRMFVPRKEFAAVLKVRYQDYDIKEVKLIEAAVLYANNGQQPTVRRRAEKS